MKLARIQGPVALRAAVLVVAALTAVGLARGQQPTNDAAQEAVKANRLKYLLDYQAALQKHPSFYNTNAEAQKGELFERYIALVQEPGESNLGATFEPADEALRTQLALPKDHGLIVTSVVEEGPAALAGIQARDILLELDGVPLATPEDLIRRLKEVGEKDVPLEVIRKGKPTKLRVRPYYRVTVGPPNRVVSSYFVGVAVEQVGDALRAHVSLPEGVGLVIQTVAKDSPAEKAGVKVHDVLTRLDQTPLKSAEDLVKGVQGAGAREITLEIVRGGETRRIKLTPVMRTTQVEPTEGALRLWKFPDPTPYGTAWDRTMLRDIYKADRVSNAASPPAPEKLGGQLEALKAQIDALSKKVDDLVSAQKESGQGARKPD